MLAPSRTTKGNCSIPWALPSTRSTNPPFCVKDDGMSLVFFCLRCSLKREATGQVTKGFKRTIKKGKRVEEIRDYDDSRDNNPNKRSQWRWLTAFLNMIKDGDDKDISSFRICLRLLCLFDAFCLVLQLFTLFIFFYTSLHFWYSFTLFYECVLDR